MRDFYKVKWEYNKTCIQHVWLHVFSLKILFAKLTLNMHYFGKAIQYQTWIAKLGHFKVMALLKGWTFKDLELA